MGWVDPKLDLCSLFSSERKHKNSITTSTKNLNSSDQMSKQLFFILNPSKYFANTQTARLNYGTKKKNKDKQQKRNKRKRDSRSNKAKKMENNQEIKTLVLTCVDKIKAKEMSKTTSKRLNVRVESTLENPFLVAQLRKRNKSLSRLR